MPPHGTYIETHLGGGAVLRHKRPARRTIGIDLDPAVIEAWRQDNHDGIELVCGDALAFLQGFPFTGAEMVYADPPYLMETCRSGPLYRYETTTEQHRELLDCLQILPCKVMISGYWSALYEKALKSGNAIIQALARRWQIVPVTKPSFLRGSR